MESEIIKLKKKKTDTEIVILIPAYNEEKYIKKVIKGCSKYGLDIIVVDDGSSDNTLKVVKSIPAPKNYRIILLKHEINKGKGKSLKTGFKYIIEKNYPGVITLDADGQHNTEEIKNFLKIVKKGKPDLIIGDRMGNTAHMPFIRLATNVITSRIISAIAGKRVNDVQSGFRYIRTDVLKNINLETGNFDTEPELIIKSSWSGYNIKNIPISTIYHKNFISHVNPANDTIKFFRLVFNSIKWKRKFYKNKQKNVNKKSGKVHRKQQL
jgi:glycosyltransferase involved in cell wall biosynthesis